MASDVPAVAIAVRMLERMARQWPEPMPSGSLIEELELNRSTAYNILGTLQRAGWTVSRGDRSGWSLGPRLLALTGAPAEATTKVVQREIDAMSRRLGFVVFAAVSKPDGYSVLARAERASGVRVTVSVGDTFPFSAPAIMAAFYAWSPETEFARRADQYGLIAFTEHTVTDRGRLREILAQTRRRGYATSLQQYDLAQSGVAAPVFDARGRVRMVICSLAFSTELDASTIDRVGCEIRDCALRITHATGGVSPKTC